jgi:hypothetical protein
MMIQLLRGGASMNQTEFDALHARCVDAFGTYVDEAEKTAMMFATCTAEPMPLAARLEIAVQEKNEVAAHLVYLAEKLILHNAARLGYAFTD